MMPKHLRIAFFILVIIINCNCKSNSVGPQSKPSPGRRDYIWKIDTLPIKYGSLTRIWGDSPSNIYAIGPVDANENIWHYDGTKWNCDYISRQIEPTAIFGDAEDNVWLAGRGGKIWYYNGNAWAYHSNLFINKESTIGIENLCGNSRNDILGVGYLSNKDDSKGLIIKYNGDKWYIIDSSTSKSTTYIDIENDKDENGVYFIQGIKFGNYGRITSVIIKYDKKNQYEIYSDQGDPQNECSVSSISGKVYFVFGSKIYKYKPGGNEYITEIKENGFDKWIVGRDESDLFCYINGGIAHYNGLNVSVIYELEKSKVAINGSLIFENDVYFLGYDYVTKTNLIIHGTLK